MASAVVYEKFWTSKSACCEAERRHYESLAKYPVVMDDVKKVTEEAPVPAPQKDKREKPSRRRRRNKGSASHSESSNRADSVSESPIESRDDKVEVPPSPVKTPAEPRIEPQIVKEQKENKNDKGNKREENVTKKDTEKIVDNEANLNKMDSVLASMPNVDVTNKLNNVVNEVSQISVALNDLRSLVMSLKKDVEQLKSQKSRQTSESKPGASQPAKPAPAPTAKEDTDDGVDLFASDSDDEEAAKIKEERLAAYAAKKAKKPALIAKSSIILDVKPWDDETDMGAMEKEVRKITSDGLLWGASKLVPLAYGIKKLQINCVVEDEKISIDWLQEEIEGITELVQSCDIAAFNKI